MSEIDNRDDGAGSDYERIEEEDEETTTEATVDVAIDTVSGEPISVDIADNQDSENEDTTETVVTVTGIEEETEGDESSGLTTNQILLGILGALNTGNKLKQEQNKRLRDLNRTLKRGLVSESPIAHAISTSGFHVAHAVNNVLNDATFDVSIGDIVEEEEDNNDGVSEGTGTTEGRETQS